MAVKNGTHSAVQLDGKPVLKARLFSGGRPASAAEACTLHEAASFVFVLRPAGLAGAPDWVRGAVSGQVPPRRCRPNAPPTYIPPKAIGMAGSFHPAS